MTNFVPVTAVPVTTTVSVPFEVSPSITGKHDVPSHLEVALDNTTEVTAALADDNTIIHIVPTVATNSTPVVAPKGLHYSNVKNGTQVCLDDQTLSEGNETEKLTKIAPAIANSSAVTISSLNSTRSSYTARLTNTGSSVAPVSLIATRSFGSFAEHFLNGWNTTFRTLLSQQTGVATVPSVTKAALIASKPFGSLAGYGLGGWNATSRTLLRENIVGSVNQPAELSSQPTGVNDNLLTRPGTGSFLAASTSSLNATNTKGAGQLGSVLVPTIKSIGVSRTKNPNGTALTLPFPVATASDPTAQNKLGIACRFHQAGSSLVPLTFLTRSRENFCRHSSVELGISRCSRFSDKLIRTEQTVLRECPISKCINECSAARPNKNRHFCSTSPLGPFNFWR